MLIGTFFLGGGRREANRVCSRLNVHLGDDGIVRRVEFK